MCEEDSGTIVTDHGHNNLIELGSYIHKGCSVVVAWVTLHRLEFSPFKTRKPTLKLLS